MFMFWEMNRHPEAVVDALGKGDPPTELLKRIFSAKRRQMDFYYGEKVVERLKNAGDSNPGLVPSFLSEWERTYQNGEVVVNPFLRGNKDITKSD